MSPRARHALEMRTALELNCSLAEARLHLAKLAHRAVAQARKASPRASRVPLPRADRGDSQFKFWWKDRD